MVETIGARLVIEVGTFVGYTTLWIAQALPDGGRVVACDVNASFVDIGRPFWRESGHGGKIDVRLAPALETMDRILAEAGPGSVDLVFIDADKGNYVAYYEHVVQVARAGGLILIDNVFWNGAVTSNTDRSVMTSAIRELNDRVRDDARVHAAMLPLGDGVTLCRKRV
jgi:predicted O-methyltransferase YrrM